MIHVQTNNHQILKQTDIYPNITWARHSLCTKDPMHVYTLTEFLTHACTVVMSKDYASLLSALHVHIQIKRMASHMKP